MKVLVVDNISLYKDENNDYYSGTLYDYAFMQRYLEVFNEVRLIAKVRPISEASGKTIRKVSGPGVEVFELPWYQGLREMKAKGKELFHKYRISCKGVDCCIFRVAQIESYLTDVLGRPRRMPYAVEVVNDPSTFVGIPNILKKISVLRLKHLTKHANCASYVTEYVLQRSYPAGKKAYTTSYSSIDLDKSDIFHTPLNWNGESPFRIVHVANAINDDSKGHSTAIHVAQKLISQGIDIQIDFIGDGNKVPQYERIIKEYGIEQSVRFIGRIVGRKQLLTKLRDYNLMLLPTKMEGLPRTIIEACAVGLPCLSSPTAGVVELIEKPYLFLPDDVDGFANKISELIQNRNELSSMSEANLNKADKYTNDKLKAKRTILYKHLKKCVRV